MDTGEQYIKMMSGAWPDLKGDMPISSLLFSRNLRMLYILDGKVVMWREEVNTSNCERAIPLLEQDQLQEMVRTEERDDFWLIRDMARWVHQRRIDMPDYPRFANSPEQLWLAYVMKELYGKVWSGEGWVST